MEKIKLVIWDLDDTFWKGTLSEGAVDIIPQNIQIVKELVDRGIMNSIVSKNDYDKAKKQLESFGIWDMFIFPKISWNPKGEIVKQLLEQCKLRPNNTLFVDDNHSNLQEVKFYNPDIQILNATDFTLSILNDDAFKGKDDKSHSRLEQYKILEQRANEETKYSSNIEFLQDSHIKVSIEKDCLNEKDRIAELIQRTNQLNFTKNRISKEELESLLTDKASECRLIRVKDRFGDYGIVGFYALKGDILEHFLFSCRILGLGVENYVYNKLHCPKITISGEVASELKEADITWITEKTFHHQTERTQKPSILMIGGCDLQQTDYYLSGKYDIKKEFATVVDGLEIRTSDSSQLVNSLKLPEGEKELLCKNFSFYHKDITFATQLFSNKQNIIIYSVVDDYIRAVFRNKTKDYSITLFGYFDYENELPNLMSQQDKSFLNDHFVYEGSESESFFEDNLRFILNHIYDTCPDTLVLLINGNEIDVSDWIGKERCERQVSMNQVVDRVINDYENVHLIDMRTIVRGREDFSQNDNRHYERSVYYRMSMEIIRILQEVKGIDHLTTHKDFVVSFKYLLKKIHDTISVTLFKK